MIDNTHTHTHTHSPMAKLNQISSNQELRVVAFLSGSQRENMVERRDKPSKPHKNNITTDSH